LAARKDDAPSHAGLHMPIMAGRSSPAEASPCEFDVTIADIPEIFHRYARSRLTWRAVLRSIADLFR
jgi:hypothetical protein